jgi:FlaA1/EpsC-like NDP-sugar epimerase
LLIIISGGSRFFVRILREYISTQYYGKKVLIIGAGDAGEMIVRDMKNNPKISYEPIGFIDEDPYKKGLTIHGVPIFGPSSILGEIIEKNKPEEILISVPSASKEFIKKIYDICKPFNIPIKKQPALNDILNGNIISIAKLGEKLMNNGLINEQQLREALHLQEKEGGRVGSKLVKLGYVKEDQLVSFLQKQYGLQLLKPISLEDLLEREPIKTEIESVRNFITGKSVLVTGAGGSIGSELSRQIIRYQPKNLILLDRYENSLFSLDCELNGFEEVKSNKNVTTVVGDILENSRLEHLFTEYKPQVVFHAAAYKHVPLMEHNPVEAIKNNIIGTKNVINAAVNHNTANFVMISTDKAVNPTSIMGATKRIAEYLTISMNSKTNTKFTTVRFGNVLGSNGSVIPLFKKQLKNGGPLKVTHPDVKRYFMLISEAVQLVLIAASSGEDGKIFVLDMGEPIKILDLTENLIRLSGFIPHKEIKIEFSGLRPGEKLSEELFDKSERIIPTFHKHLNIAIPDKTPSYAALDQFVSDLKYVIKDYSVDKVLPKIREILPEFNNFPLKQENNNKNKTSISFFSEI